MGLSNARIFKEFKNKIIRTKFELLKLLIEIKRKKKKLFMELEHPREPVL